MEGFANTTPGNYDGLYDGALTIQTISNPTKDQINSILGQILNQLNEQTDKRYFLRKIDRLNVQPLKKGVVGCEQSFKQTGEFVLGARYTVDFFAHELRNQETRRFIAVFGVDTSGIVHVEHLSYSNAYLDSNAVSPKGQTWKPMSGPGSLIISNDSLMTPTSYHIQAQNDGTKLDMHPFKPDGNIPAGHAGSWETAQVFLPFHISAETYHPDRLWPNRRQSKWWDSNGVFFVENSNPANGRVGIEHGNTYGLNNTMLDSSFNGPKGDNNNVPWGTDLSYTPNRDLAVHSMVRPPGVYDNPTVARMNSNAYENKAHWLFDMARGNLAMGQTL
jgi:hypothetical protein